MSGWHGALVTALLAVVAFIAGQGVLRFVVEPIQEQRRLIGEITHALLFYNNVYLVEQVERLAKLGEQRISELEEARTTLRGLAGRLHESLWVVPAYDTLARIRWVRTKGAMLTAAKHLVGLSNSVYGGSTTELRDRRRAIIAEALGITRKIGPLE